MVNSLQLVQGLSHLPQVLSEASSFFSQSGEDIAVEVLLAQEKEKGIVLDIGAYHPFRFSNTMLLYLKGWRGVNVDGNPHTIELFKQFRGDEINIHAIVSDKEEEIQFFRFQEGAYNTTNPVAARELSARGRPETTIVETTTHKTTAISTILDAHIGTKKFDFLNIDVEGLDLRIFYSIDFTKYRPKIVCLEIGIAEWSAEPLKTFLKSIRYCPASQCVNSAILVRED